ncbi:MAG: hypothetical protein KF760_29895 [Candidatus Eremiobacteraeota bacterium]|nr:hypothetical protein [Candidatus Eremiobacteraeota bacterium]MCW5866904.1 hypothetical protein [Candidatus Eremiobacteraeota bacterium]
MRRLLLIVVAFLWVTNGVLLAWVKMTPPPPPPAEKKLLLVYCEKKDQPKKVSKVLEGLNLKPEIRSNQAWKHEVQEGFIVVNRVTDPDVRKGIFAGMKNLLPVKIVGDDIRLGGVYKTKPEAAKAAAGARNKGFTFQVVDNIVTRTTKVQVVRVASIEETKAGEAEEALKKLNLNENQIVVESLDAPAGASAMPTP